MSRLARAIIAIGVVVIIVIMIGVGAVLVASGGDIRNFIQRTVITIQLSNRQTEIESPIGTDTTPIRFTINSGDSASIIANNLRALNLIRDTELFVNYLRLYELDTELEAGTYFLNQTQNIPTIAVALTDSRNSSITFRIFEGSRIEEIAERIDATPLFSFSGNEFIAVVSNSGTLDADFLQRMGIPLGVSIEGFLYPDTYVLPPRISATELRDLLIAEFDARITNQMISDAQAQGLSIRDVVTLASIIEREAVWNDEKPLISSVYRNRLNIGMKLDADPTVQYALGGSRESWWPQITLADYQNVQSPFNTYLTNGLPPGPIANPSVVSIEAAIYPTQSEYFYFRAKCDGSNYHEFARTFEEHLANAC